MGKDIVFGIRMTFDGKEVNGGLTVTRDQLKRLSGEVGDAATESGRLGEALGRVGHYAAAAFSVGAAVSFARAVAETQAEAQKLAATLTYSSGSAEAAAKDLQYLQRVTRQLGLDYSSSAKAFASFSAAAAGSAISADTIKKTFEGVSKAAATLGLSAAETEGALLAVSQMVSKGTVSAEELRGQLGERLPGAFQIAARAMGVTTGELGKMLEQGQLATADFLPKFAAEMNRSFATPVKNAATAINELSSAWTLWKQQSTEGAGGGFGWLTDGLNESTAAMRNLGKEAGIVHRLLVAIGGFEAGALGLNKFDTVKLQEQALQRFSNAQDQMRELEGRKYLTPFERQDLAQYRREMEAARRELDALAMEAGKAQGIQLPDLKGEFEAQQAKRNAALQTYLGDTKNAPKAVKIAEDIEAENKAFKAATAEFGKDSAEYAQALKAHNERLAEIRRKGEEKPPKPPKPRAEKDELPGLLNELAGLSSTYSRDLAALERAFAGGRIGVDQYREAVEALIAKQPFARDLARQEAEAQTALAMAQWQAYEAEYKRGEALAQDAARLEAQAQQEEARVARIGLTARELAALERAEIDAAVATEERNLASLEAAERGDTLEADAIRRKIEALERLRAASAEGAVKEANTQAAQEAAGEWEKVADGVAQSLTDAIFDGGSDGWRLLRKTIQAQVIRMTILPVVQGGVQSVLSGVGLGSGAVGTAGGGGGGGGSGFSLSNIPGLGGGSLFGNGLLSLGSSAALSGTALGAFSTGAGTALVSGAGFAASMEAAGGLIASGSAAGAAAGAGMALATAAPYIAAIVAIASAAGAFKGPSYHSGSAVATNLDDSQSILGHNARFGDTRVWGGFSETDAKGGSAFAPALKTLGASVAGAIESTLKDFGSNAQVQVYAAFGADGDDKSRGNLQVYDAQGRELASNGGANLRGVKYSKDASKGIQEFADDAGMVIRQALLAADLPAWADSILQSIGADPGMQALNAALATISQLQAAAKILAPALDLTADQFVGITQAMGGLSAAQPAWDAYFQNFYSNQERQAIGWQALGREFAKLNLAMPDSRAGFRALVEGIDVSTAAGQALYAQVLGLSTAFAQVTEAGAEMGSTWQDLAADLRDFRRELTGGDLAQLSPEAAYQAASAQFTDTRRLAALGNEEALGSLADVGRSFLEASQQYFASGTAYFADRDAVLAAVDAGIALADRKLAIPGFAGGGDHLGGFRIVGERGAELEATGPARIFNAAQTRDILAGASATGQPSRDAEIIRELQAVVRVLSTGLSELRNEISDLKAEAAEQARQARISNDKLRRIA